MVNKDCEKALDLINEYIDGELVANDTEFVRSHIEKCPECRRVYEELKEIKNLLESNAEEAPTELYDRVMDEVRVEKNATRRKNHVMRKWSFAAVAAVICLSVLSTPTILMLVTEGAKSECEDNAIFDAVENAPAEEAPTNSGGLGEKADDNQYCCTEEAYFDADNVVASILVDSGEYTAYLKSGEKITITLDTENMVAYIGEKKYTLKISDVYCLTRGFEKLCFTLKTGDTVSLVQTD